MRDHACSSRPQIRNPPPRWNSRRMRWHPKIATGRRNRSQAKYCRAERSWSFLLLRLFVGFRFRRVWVETLVVAWLECFGQRLHFFLGGVRARFGLRLLACFVLSG